MDGLAQATDRLTAAGYREGFRAAAGGLAVVRTGRVYAPEALQVDEVVRFEGPTDPADEAVVFALRSPEDGVKGTWVVAYGPVVDGLDAKMVRRLRSGRR